MVRYSEKTGLAQAYQVGPFDSTHIYVQWGGKLPGDEEWSCGFRMWKAAGSTPSDATALLSQVSAAISAYHLRSTSHISAKVKLSFVKCNAIDVNGHYQGAGTTEQLFADVSGGGTGSGNNPNQIALAVSLTTGFSRGPAHRGRFFNPCPDVGVDTDGTISPGQALETATSAKALMTAINLGGAEQMVVMSRKAGAPGHRAVTGAQVGRILDTQRRRRNSLLENYSTAP